MAPKAVSGHDMSKMSSVNCKTYPNIPTDLYRSRSSYIRLDTSDDTNERSNVNKPSTRPNGKVHDFLRHFQLQFVLSILAKIRTVR
jgi:hypothetical protein